MAKRRSFDDALSPDEAAFLKGSGVASGKATLPKSSLTERDEQPIPALSASLRKILADSRSDPAIQPLIDPASRGAASSGRGATSGGVNARIDPKITNALLLASVGRRMEGKMPFMQRDIIAEALTDWLKKHGYSIA